MKLDRRIFTIIVAILMFASMELTVLADTWYLEQGDVVVNAGVSGQSVSQGTVTKADSAPVITQQDSSVATSNTITVNTENGADANITIQDVNIQASSGAAIETNRSEGSSVTVELEGSNTLVGGFSHAGLETNGTGDLMIQDTDDDGSLKAEGGQNAAGIGGGSGEDGLNITITGGVVNAVGGSNAYGTNGAAGIGGGSEADGNNITISGGNVTAIGGSYGAGIGGGAEGDGTDITISGGAVEATGGSYGAGIGGGEGANGENIAISGGEISAQGGHSGAGVGGGKEGDGTDITISGGTVEAEGGNRGAGIGGGYNGVGSDITITDGDVTAEGGDHAAGIGGGENSFINDVTGTDIVISGGNVEATGGYRGAGIGGGKLGNGANITISGGIVVAQGGGEAAGIGGGHVGKGSNIVVKDQAQVTAIGQNSAADSGNGSPTFEEPQSDDINLDDLYTTGSYTNRYGTVHGTKVPPKVVIKYPHICSRNGAEIREGNLYCRCGELLLKLYEVNCPWVEKLENGVLTITVEESDAILIYWLFGIQALVEQDVHTLVFETEQAKTVLELEDWLAENTADGEYQICHTGQETRILQTQ